MIKNLLNKLTGILIAMQKARAASILARNGMYKQAQALYKD